MSKKNCKENDKKKLERRTKDAEFRCKSCGALAPREKFLCKPKSI